MYSILHMLPCITAVAAAYYVQESNGQDTTKMVLELLDGWLCRLRYPT